MRRATKSQRTGRSGSAGGSRAGPRGVLDVSHITVSYGQRPVLRDVSISAGEGELLAVIGPNGAGKSTLLRSIVGLVPVDAGVVTLAGRAATEVRSSFAYLSQSAAIDPSYPATVRDVVASGRWPDLRAVRWRLRRDESVIVRSLAQVGLEEFAAVPVGELSGGQHRRMLLARALCQGARVLLLDEPYAGVDAATERLMVRVLTKVADEGATVIVVQHGLATLTARYTRVVLLHGRVIADGPPAQVLVPAHLAKAYLDVPYQFRRAGREG